MWSDHVPDDWRCTLNLSMFLLVLSVGRDWMVHTVLEFSAMKKNLKIISNIKKVLWTVLFREDIRKCSCFLLRVTPTLLETGLCVGSLVLPVVKLI